MRSFLGFSHCGSVTTTGSGFVELTDDEVCCGTAKLAVIDHWLWEGYYSGCYDCDDGRTCGILSG